MQKGVFIPLCTYTVGSFKSWLAGSLMVRQLRGPGCIMFAAATWEQDFQFLVCHFPSLRDCPDARTFTVMERKGAKTPASSTPLAWCSREESTCLETVLCHGTESIITWPCWYIKGNCIIKWWEQCYKHIKQQIFNRKNPTNWKPFFFFFLMPNDPHKTNSLISWPLSCAQTSGPCMTSETSRTERKKYVSLLF